MACAAGPCAAAAAASGGRSCVADVSITDPCCAGAPTPAATPARGRVPVKVRVPPPVSAGPVIWSTGYLFCRRTHVFYGRSHVSRLTLRIAVLIAGVCALASQAAASTQVPAAAIRPPNVVFVLVDDLGWADLGCYGSTFHETPNLDRLAAGGVRFTQAYAASPVCSPTRAALMCGKHPARLNLTTYLPGRRDLPTQKLLQAKIRQELPLDELTL